MSATTLRPRSGVVLPRLGNSTVVAMATLAMVAATAWAVMSAAWVDGTGAMLVCAVAAVLEATLVARSSAGRVVALLMLPVVGALVVVPLTYGSIPGSSTISIGDAARQYLDAFATGLFVQGDWPFLVGLCGIFWIIGSWSGWLAVRERRGVLAVIPCYAVLAVNALNAPSLQNVWLPEAVAVALSLVVVARVHLLSLSARWRRSGVVALPGTERRFGRVTWMAAVLLLLAALIVPPVSSRDVSGTIFHFNGSSGRGTGLGSGTGTGSGPGGPGQVRFDPNAIPGSQLVSNPQPVLSYTTDTDQSVYLRVVDDDYFSSGNWFATGPSLTNDPSVAIGQIPASGGQIPRDSEPLDGGVARPSSLQSVTARFVLEANATGNDQLGIFPGEPVSISEEGLAQGLLAAGGTGLGQAPLLTVDQYRINTGNNSYVAAGTVSTASPSELRGAGTQYPPFVTAAYLGLNPVTRTDVQQVATLTQLAHQWTAGTADPYDAASAIESHLRDTSVFTYTLTPPATQPGVWPVIDFLTRTRHGYCQYFADAMGALLRADGIPARLVSGYGPGTVDDSTSRSGSQALHLVTTSDAHVWVEAYFPGYGWVPFEPTPDGTYAPIPRGPEPNAAGAPTPSPSSSAAATPKPTSTPRPDEAAPLGSSTSASIPPGLIGGLLGVGLVAAALVALRRWLARPRNLPGVWRRVLAVGAVLGVRRRPSETYAAYVHRLSAALPPDTVTLGHRDGSGEVGPRPVRERVRVALEQIAAVSGKAEFSAGGLDEREAVQWHRAWDRVRRAVPVLVWRSMLSRGVREVEPEPAPPFVPNPAET
jgi:transglutaminase-like putative cysteine protease